MVERFKAHAQIGARVAPRRLPFEEIFAVPSILDAERAEIVHAHRRFKDGLALAAPQNVHSRRLEMLRAFEPPEK